MASIIIIPLILFKVFKEIIHLIRHIKKDKKNQTPIDAFNLWLEEDDQYWNSYLDKSKHETRK